MKIIWEFSIFALTMSKTKMGLGIWREKVPFRDGWVVLWMLYLGPFTLIAFPKGKI
jgi:hypothetical protein